MAISPFPARPGTPENEGRRTRLVIALATLGIAASLFAYAVSPSVRHAVVHAGTSVRHAVGRMFDHDRAAHARARTPAHRLQLVQPLQGTRHAHSGRAPSATGAHTSSTHG